MISFCRIGKRKDKRTKFVESRHPSIPPSDDCNFLSIIAGEQRLLSFSNLRQFRFVDYVHFFNRSFSGDICSFLAMGVKIAVTYKSNGAGNHIIVPTNEKEQ
jgi:hypothetical protein